MMREMQVTPALRRYVEEQIIPMYDTFDPATGGSMCVT